MGFLDYIFPKKCVICKKLDSFLCADCFTRISFDVKNSCLICKKPSLNGLTHTRCRKEYTIDGCFSALCYNKPVKILLYNFKNKPYLIELKELLVDLFYESIIQNEDFIKATKEKRWIIITASLPKKELRQRGYNQAEILAKGLAKKLNLQVKKTISDAENINIFLVADVVETGSAFLREAERLKRNGAKKVIALTLSRKQKPPLAER